MYYYATVKLLDGDWIDTLPTNTQSQAIKDANKIRQAYDDEVVDIRVNTTDNQ